MTRNEARNLHVSAALVGVTGLIYGWMRYFVIHERLSFSGFCRDLAIRAFMPAGLT